MIKALETRIPPPVVALAFAILSWWLATFLPTLEIGLVPKVVVVTLLVALGVFFDGSGIVTFRKARTTISPLKPGKASALVKSGIYRVTRNPMYMGLVFFLSAWCTYLNSPLALICVAGFALYIQTFQIRPEERMLVELFGDEYQDYRSSVRRWL